MKIQDVINKRIKIKAISNTEEFLVIGWCKETNDIEVRRDFSCGVYNEKRNEMIRFVENDIEIIK